MSSGEPAAPALTSYACACSGADIKTGGSLYGKRSCQGMDEQQMTPQCLLAEAHQHHPQMLPTANKGGPGVLTDPQTLPQLRILDGCSFLPDSVPRCLRLPHILF